MSLSMLINCQTTVCYKIYEEDFFCSCHWSLKRFVCIYIHCSTLLYFDQYTCILTMENFEPILTLLQIVMSTLKIFNYYHVSLECNYMLWIEGRVYFTKSITPHQPLIKSFLLEEGGGVVGSRSNKKGIQKNF